MFRSLNCNGNSVVVAVTHPEPSVKGAVPFPQSPTRRSSSASGFFVCSPPDVSRGHARPRGFPRRVPARGKNNAPEVFPLPHDCRKQAPEPDSDGGHGTQFPDRVLASFSAERYKLQPGPAQAAAADHGPHSGWVFRAPAEAKAATNAPRNAVGTLCARTP